MITNTKGVSLIEVLIRVILLVLILVPSLNVVISQTQTVTSTRDHSQAAFIADKILELAKACKFEMLDSDTYENEPDKQQKTFEYKLRNDPNYNTFEENGITYTINTDKNFTDIAPIYTIGADPDDIPSVYGFKYRIDYIGKDGKSHCLDIQTVLSQR